MYQRRRYRRIFLKLRLVLPARVVPGDRLELHCQMLRFKGTLIKTRGEAKVDGQVVAEGEFMAMLADTSA